MSLTRPGGNKVPFGALVTQENTDGGVAIVGDEGLVYLTGLPQQGTLLVTLNENQQCRVHYTLPENGKEANEAYMYKLNGVCQ